MIILICGKQGSGKSSLASGLDKALNNSFVMKFADPLYQMHDAIYKVLEDYGILRPMGQGPYIDGPLLQVLGTEWGRKNKGKDFWVEIMQKRVINFFNETQRLTGSRAHIIIDDCRFVNELNAFDSLFPTLKVKLVASEETRKKRAAKWRDNTEHPSETGLDYVADEAFDLIINTETGTKEKTLELVLRKLAV